LELPDGGLTKSATCSILGSNPRRLRAALPHRVDFRM
jgi:hypothetical protein